MILLDLTRRSEWRPPMAYCFNFLISCPILTRFGADYMAWEGLLSDPFPFNLAILFKANQRSKRTRITLLDETEQDLVWKNSETWCCHIDSNQISTHINMCFWRGSHLKNFNIATMVAIWISECMILANLKIHIARCLPQSYSSVQHMVFKWNLKNFKLAAILDIRTEPWYQI